MLAVETAPYNVTGAEILPPTTAGDPAPRHYVAVLNVLRGKHLLFE